MDSTLSDATCLLDAMTTVKGVLILLSKHLQSISYIASISAWKIIDLSAIILNVAAIREKAHTDSIVLDASEYVWQCQTY